MSTAAKRPFFVPEVIQTSAMDCGPACVKAALTGLGIDIHFERLREACQTDIDGTSIDTLEELLTGLGLDAEQVMLPVDHVLAPETRPFPSIVVTTVAGSATHFVVLWGRAGGFVQLMDPGVGRRWTTEKRFLRELFVHKQRVPASAWREWAGGEASLAIKSSALRALRVDPKPWIDTAVADPSWVSLAALDAAIRTITRLAQAGASSLGGGAGQRLLEHFLLGHDEVPFDRVPAADYSVRPDGVDHDGDPQLRVAGALLLTLGGRPTERAARPIGESALATRLGVGSPAVNPERALLDLLLPGDRVRVAVLAGVALLVGATALLPTLALRAALDVADRLRTREQMWGAAAFILALTLVMFLLEWSAGHAAARLGRHLETRLRVALLECLPSIPDPYFQSRLASDMTARAHGLAAVRTLPTLLAQALVATSELLVTVVALAVLSPATLAVSAAAGLLVAAMPLVFQRVTREPDLTVRAHAAALGRFYLDALIGVSPILAHRAERTVRREHESLLVTWLEANRSLIRASTSLEGASYAIVMAAAIAIVCVYARDAGNPGALLLVAFWALRLPRLLQRGIGNARAYPSLRNRVLRLLEPLTTSTRPAPSAPPQPRPNEERVTTSPSGAALTFEHVSVKAGGHVVLEDVNLSIPAGRHVAIVGASGAGKSTLIGLLLGWHAPESGVLRLDGTALAKDDLESLRQVTAWVEPAVTLWNRTVIDNLRYGQELDASHRLGEVLGAAEIHDILQRLPEGLQSRVGEGGGLVSGGQGQRIRFGRALLHRGPRLVLLDEPFRGLERDQRSRLMATTRAWWRSSTILCATHDVVDTLDFDEVLVVDGGRIVESGPPRELAASASRYRALLDAQSEVDRLAWNGTDWRKMRLEDGRLQEHSSSEHATTAAIGGAP